VREQVLHLGVVDRLGLHVGALVDVANLAEVELFRVDGLAQYGSAA